MKIWIKQNELIADNNIRTDGSILICDKNITVDELKFYKLNAAGNDIEIDVVETAAYDKKIFDDLLAAKKIEIETMYDNALSTGKFLSASLNIIVDCRRGGTKNDIQNIDIIILKMTSASIQTIDFVGIDIANTAIGVTIPQLRTLQLEMIDYGFAIESKMIAIMKLLENVTTIAGINSIAW